MNPRALKDRIFTPPTGATPTSHASYDPKTGLTHLVSPSLRTRYPVDKTTALIHTDGACYNNGRPNARSAYACYFGPGSCWNAAKDVCYHCSPQTSQYAELFAVDRAIFTWEEPVNSTGEKTTPTGQPTESEFGKGVETVVVVTDSAYVVGCMTDYIVKWRVNGFKNSKGKKVEHADIIEAMDKEIEHLRECHGVDVKFWLVKRNENQAADKMAKEALRERLLKGDDEELEY